MRCKVLTRLDLWEDWTGWCVAQVPMVLLQVLSGQASALIKLLAVKALAAALPQQYMAELSWMHAF